MTVCEHLPGLAADLERLRDLTVALECRLEAAEEACRAAERYLEATSADSLGQMAFAVLSWRLSQ